MKKVLVGLLLAVILLAAVGFVLPGSFDVQRSIAIAAPPAVVHASLAELRTWPEWSAWTKEGDPTVQWSWEGGPGAGARWTWAGETYGKGELRIETSDPASGITYTMAMEGMSPVHGSVTLAPVASGTEVRWHDRGELGMNPIYRWMGVLAFDRMLGGMFEKSLKGLQARSEKAALAAPAEAALKK